MDTFTAKVFLSQLGAARAVLIASTMLALGLAAVANAGTIYTYTGNNYTACGGSYCSGGPYALSVTFDTTLTGNALENLPFTDITATVTSFQFTDGSSLTFNNSNDDPAQRIIQISTNASGNVVAWFAGAYSFPAETQMQTNWNSPFGFVPGADFSETTSNFAGDYGFIPNNPGTWTVAVSTTPEPSTFALLAAGLLTFWIILARRHFRIAV